MLFTACGFGGDAGGTDAGAAADGDAPPGQGDGTPDSSVAPDSGASDAPVGSGNYLTAMALPAMPDVDLETEGTLGWTHWHFPMGGAPTLVTDVKASAPTAIPTFTLAAGNDLAGLGDFATKFHWTNGMPEVMSMPAGDSGGVYLKNPFPPSFHLSIPASTQKRRLVVYCGLFSASAQFTAALGALKAEPAPLGADDGQNGYIRYAVDFESNEGGNLDVTWTLLSRTKNNGNANITLSAATLAPSP